MNSFQLKVWACLFMAVDHVGAILLDDHWPWRAIGRLSLPIFAFLLVEGFRMSKNRNRYAFRLLLFALISQPIYSQVFRDYSGIGLNILYTLLAGWGMLWFQQKNYPLLWLASFALIAEIADLSYGSYAIIMIWCLSQWDGVSSKALMQWLAVPVCWQALRRIGALYFHYGANGIVMVPFVIPLIILDSLAWFACFWICRYNHQQGRRWQYLFYLFYPVHLWILGMLKGN